MINLENKTQEQLIALADSVKVSDLSYEEKTKLLIDIEYKLNGKRNKRDEILKSIEESAADIDDIIGV